MGLKQIAANPAYACANLAVKVVAPQGMTQPVFSLPVVIDDDGVIDAAHLFNKSEGSTRQRRGCFVEVTGSEGNSCYWVILEGTNQRDQPSVRQIENTEFGVIFKIL